MKKTIKVKIKDNVIWKEKPDEHVYVKSIRPTVKFDSDSNVTWWRVKNFEVEDVGDGNYTISKYDPNRSHVVLRKASNNGDFIGGSIDDAKSIMCVNNRIDITSYQYDENNNLSYKRDLYVEEWFKYDEQGTDLLSYQSHLINPIEEDLFNLLNIDNIRYNEIKDSVIVTCRSSDDNNLIDTIDVYYFDAESMLLTKHSVEVSGHITTVITYEYDENGYPSRTTRHRGDNKYITTTTYDKDGYLIFKMSDNDRVFNTYDSNHNLVSSFVETY